MKTGVIETVSETNHGTSTPGRSRGRLAADYAELVKARLTLLVLLTTAVGYYMGARHPIRFAGLFHVIFGAASAAAGAAALNQWWERKADALMERTKMRPLPNSRMRPAEALIAGTALSLFGVIYLAIACNVLSACLAAATILIYVLAYTPLKRVSDMNTLVGAVPGALPPLIGWAAARGTIDAGGWCLFAILFFWQLPHFFAIAWMCRDDYSRAGFQMISSDDRTGERSASQSVFFCILLVVIAGLPTFIGLNSQAYLVAEIILSGAFVAVRPCDFFGKGHRRARGSYSSLRSFICHCCSGALALTKI